MKRWFLLALLLLSVPAIAQEQTVASYSADLMAELGKVQVGIQQLKNVNDSQAAQIKKLQEQLAAATHELGQLKEKENAK